MVEAVEHVFGNIQLLNLEGEIALVHEPVKPLRKETKVIRALYKLLSKELVGPWKIACT